MKNNKLSRSFLPILLCVFTIAISGCYQQSHIPISQAAENTEKQQAVAMPDTFAAKVAMDVLNDGGNAVDAAVAAQFSLAVTLPEAGNIGGGGFMVIHFDDTNDFVDYREFAPKKAHRDMYLDEKGEVKRLESIFGILASGVPGSVSGMWEAHQKYGSLPWERLLAPSIALAKDGFIVPEKLANNIANYIKRLESRGIEVNFADYFASAKAGEVFVQSELASTLERIQKLGKDGFYKGETAVIIENFMQKHGGLISQSDLAHYKAKFREPIVSKWRDYEVVSAAPPSSGGIAVAQWLQMYDEVKARVPNKGELTHNSPLYIHILAEAGKRVFADRAEYLGDPDFFDVPKTALLDPKYIAMRASDIKLDRISTTELIKPGLPESEQTTHFSIADKFGNAVSNTTTINLGFGSGMVVEGAGFLLNDEMDDFSAKAGVPNFFGAVGGVANEIQPYKRMLSSMTPTIVLQNGKIKMVTGSPGGTTILSSVYLSILNAIEFNMSIQDVVDAPRFHHQLLPKDQIRFHSGMPTNTLKALEEMGYNTRESRFGDLHVIVERNGKLEAASETNGRGQAMVETAKN
jgi:gamma-glutamyltranspeptidase/glutathione hydrolase